MGEPELTDTQKERLLDAARTYVRIWNDYEERGGDPQGFDWLWGDAVEAVLKENGHPFGW